MTCQRKHSFTKYRKPQIFSKQITVLEFVNIFPIIKMHKIDHEILNFMRRTAQECKIQQSHAEFGRSTFVCFRMHRNGRN